MTKKKSPCITYDFVLGHIPNYRGLWAEHTCNTVSVSKLHITQFILYHVTYLVLIIYCHVLLAILSCEYFIPTPEAVLSKVIDTRPWPGSSVG